MGEKQLTEVTTKKTAKKAVPSVSTKLTPKQKKFCQNIARGKNATQAALDAGYSADTARQIACENLTKPYILQEVEQAAQKAQQKLDYKDAQHFIDLGRMQQLAEQKGDIATALKALVQKGKLCGLYVDKLEATQTLTLKDDWKKIAEDLGIKAG